MRKYNVIHGAEMQDNGKTVNKLTVQATVTENEKGSDEEIKKIQERLIDMVADYMSSVE